MIPNAENADEGATDACCDGAEDRQQGESFGLGEGADWRTMRTGVDIAPEVVPLDVYCDDGADEGAREEDASEVGEVSSCGRLSE